MLPVKQLVLGADVGTHGVRILAVSVPDCAVLAQSSRSCGRICAEGVQELDMAEVERAFTGALEALKLPPDTVVAGVGITHQRGTIVPVDGQCVPLANAFCDSDERALDEAGFREYGFDSAVYYERTGCPVVSFNGFAKILWCRKHRPDLYQTAAAWLSAQDYLLSRLLGRLQMSAGSVLRNGFLNIRSRLPDIRLLSDAPFLQGPCAAVGACVGLVSENWAARFPFLRGAKLFAVPGDQPAAVLGSGVLRCTTMAMNLGTTFVTSTITETVPQDRTCMVTVEVLPFGLYAPEFGTGAGGQFLDFLTGLFYGQTPRNADTWSMLDHEAAEAPPGADGLQIVPLLWQATSAGIEGRIAGLRPFHNRAHLLRAAYEGLAYEARLSVDKLAGCTTVPQRLRVFGGLSGCDTFLKILSSVLGIPVEAAGQKQSSAFGAALTCAAGLGYARSMEQLRQFPAQPRCTHHPIGKERGFYETEYKRYRIGR